MINKDNLLLEKYEIKKPDYDLKEREYVGMADVVLEPERFVKKGENWESKNPENKDSIRIMFTGDITCFEKQIEEATTETGRDYDFAYQLHEVMPVFKQADLVVGNLETMIFPDAPYRTEKYVAEQNYHCNAPVEFLDAIKKAGFDVLTNANNHDMDTGAVGLGETIDYVERFGFIQTGTFKTEKKRYELIDVHGIKVAVAAFATEHNNKKSNFTEEGRNFLLNDYDKERAAAIASQAREEGAELIFACIHWGKEHKLVQNKTQMATARQLAEMGYDCIIGSHPHVLQPFSTVSAMGKTVPVFYSMGNFLSHNAVGPKSRSVIAIIDAKRTEEGFELKASYVPIHTSKDFGKKKFVVLPLTANSSNKKNIKKRELIEKVIGPEAPINGDVIYFESKENPALPSPKKEVKEPKFTADTEYPVFYDDGKFTYNIYESSAWISGHSPESKSQSYSAPDTVLDRPINGILPNAFENNTAIKKINFKKNLSFISEAMCRGCVNLEGFQLGGGIWEISEEAFKGCEKLSCVVLKKVEIVGSKAFAGCKSLRSVKMTPAVKNIADDAFEGCDNAVFYCEEGSPAEEFALKQGFKVVHMTLID